MLKGTRILCLDICDYDNQPVCNLYDNNTDISGQAANIFTHTERNGWKELSFTIPSTCFTDEGEEKNYRLQYLVADYRLRVETNTETDYYLISEPRVVHSGASKNIEVTAGHISQLLKTKNLNLEFSDEEGNNVGTAEELLRTILDGTGWKVGNVTNFLEDDGTIKVRSIVASAKTGAFMLISTLCEKFEAKPIYNGDTRTVDLVPLNPFSEVEGHTIPQEVLEGKTVLELNYGKNVSNITRTLNTENLVTRLYAYGSYGDKIDGLCSLQTVEHNEYTHTFQSSFTENSEFKFLDKDGFSYYFIITENVADGEEIVWSDLDPVSRSYVWNNTKRCLYKIHTEPQNNSWTTIEMIHSKNKNRFDYLMDFSYYDKIGLLTNEMILKLAEFQRTMPDVIDTATEASTAFINSETELSRIAESNTGFLRLDVDSYGVDDDGELILNLRKAIYSDAVIYRTDYDEARRNYFSWYCAEALKENGDPTSGIGSVVYIIHNTNPITWNKAYIKYIDGKRKIQDYSINEISDPDNITLWISKDKVGTFKGTEKFYLFATNSISGRLGVRESEIESIQQTLDQSTKVVTEKHPTYFVWDDDIAPSLEAVRNSYGWYYRTFSSNTNFGEFYFCYGIAGDTGWNKTIVSETEPELIIGGYYFNLKSKMLFHGEHSGWVNIADSDIIISSSASPYRAPNAEAKRLSQSFSKVAYYCLRYDMLHKGIYDKYIYTAQQVLEPGNYAFKNDYGFYWVFTTDETIAQGKQIWIDTIKYLVYQNDDVGNVVTPEAKPYESIDFPAANELILASIFSGSILKTTGVEENSTTKQRTNHLSVYGGVEYQYLLPENSYISFYDSNRRYLDYTDLSITGSFIVPARAKYARLVFSGTLNNNHYIRVKDYQNKLFLKETEYTILRPLEVSGERMGINTLMRSFADTADNCFMNYLKSFKEAQKRVTLADESLKEALQDLYREGYWQKNEYIEGDEEKLYKDALKNLEKISKPEATYDVQFLDLYSSNQGMGYSVTEDLYDIEWPDITISDAVHLIDEEIDINCWAFIDKLDKCYDKPWQTHMAINTDLSLIAQHSFTDVLTRIAEVANETNAKQTIYKRAAAISGSGAYAADKLEGKIKANKLLFDGGMSNWHTDSKGNLIFESVDGRSAMMLTGYGFCVSNGKDSNGDWIFRSWGTGEGFTADEIVSGEMSAVHLTAGSVTTDLLHANVGQELEIGSNKALMLYSTVDGFRPSGGLLTQVSNGDGTYRPAVEGDSYIQIAAKEGNTPAYINIVTGGVMNLQGSTMNLVASSDMNLTSSDINILAGSNINVLASGKMNLLSGGSMLVGSGSDMYVQSGGNMHIQSGGSLEIQAQSTFTVDSQNFIIDGHGNVLLRGTVYAWAGNIAGFTIGGDVKEDGSGWNRQYIYTGNIPTVSSVGSGIYLGTDGLNIGGRMRYDFSKLAIEAESVIIGKQSSGSGSLLSMNAQTGKIQLLSSSTIQLSASSSINISSGETVTIASTGSVVLGNLGSPFTIGSNGTNAYIYNGMSSLDDTNHNGIYIGTNGISLGKGIFKVTSLGALTATSATIKGEITALSGRIGAASNGTGGWIIDTNQIYADNKSVVLCSTGDYRFFAGNATAANAAFFVKKDGTIHSTKGTIGGWTISDNFLAHSSGKVGMYTKDATSSEVSFWAGNATPAQAPFYVTAGGYLNATDVTVQGTIKATSLYINGTLASIALDGNGKITLASLDNESNTNMNKAAKIILDGNNISAECLATIPDTKLNDKAQAAINKATKIEVNGTTGKILLSSLADSVVTENGLIQTLTSYATIAMIPTKISALTWDKLSSSSIEMTPSKIKIGTNGTFEVASGNFSISPEGNVTTKGTIESIAGKIGGWTIGENNLYAGSNGSYIELNSDTMVSYYMDYEPVYRTPYAFWVGANSATDAPFAIKRDGSVYLKKVIVLQEDGTEKEADLFNPNLYGYLLSKEISLTDDSITLKGKTVNFKRATSVVGGWSGVALNAHVKDQNGKNLLSAEIASFDFSKTEENIKNAFKNSNTQRISINDTFNEWTVKTITIDATNAYNRGSDAANAKYTQVTGTNLGPKISRTLYIKDGDTYTVYSTDAYVAGSSYTLYKKST